MTYETTAATMVMAAEPITGSRDALRQIPYWDETIRKSARDLDSMTEMMRRGLLPGGHLARYSLRLSVAHLRMLMLKYSRGDLVSEISQHFDKALNYWEAAEQRGENEWSPDELLARRTWAVNIERYIECFWFVGLALALKVDDAQWQRLLALVGNEGEDGLLDSVIAVRQKDRAIGRSFCYPQPYGRLWEAATAPTGYRSKFLGQFLDGWYTGLQSAVHCARQEQAIQLKQPYWVGLHASGEGMYFGYWCIEAVAAVVAFRLDDRQCIGHPHYPGDLLRPVLVTLPDSSRLPLGLF